ncbi:unnamed protein product, partial [Iphiclides podalirius]
MKWLWGVRGPNHHLSGPKSTSPARGAPCRTANEALTTHQHALDQRGGLWSNPSMEDKRWRGPECPATLARRASVD